MKRHPEWLYSKPKRNKKLIKKHEKQRVSLGVSDADLKNFDSFHSYIMVNAIPEFLDSGDHPSHMSLEQWHSICQTILDAHRQYLEWQKNFMVSSMREKVLADLAEAGKLFYANIDYFWL